MFTGLKSFVIFNTVNKDIKESRYEIALEKLNNLINEGYKLNETYMKRGKLCYKLLMLDDAYSDFSYVITHYPSNIEAYRERIILSFDMEKYSGAIDDANKILEFQPNDSDIYKYRILASAYLADLESAKKYILDLFNSDIYKCIQFLLNETAKNIVRNEFSKGLKLLNLIDFIDSGNPIKMLNEAKIYELSDNKEKSDKLLKSIDIAFPKYFLSHFKFTEIYEQRNLLETCFLLELKAFDKKNLFRYQMKLLEGYKNYSEGHILDSKECFENAISINPDKPEAYILLGQTYQLMSGYDKPEYKTNAEENYKKALDLYEKNHLTGRADTMRRQIKHLNSAISLTE